MQLPQLDPDDRGNAHLQELVRRLHPDDVSAFVEKLTTQPLRARFHTYRELLVGVHVRERSADFRYERSIDGRTPDWSLLDDSGRLQEVIDVTTLHQRNEKEREITASIRSTGRWSGWITVPPDHIYRKLNDKAGQYRELVLESQAPYVLAIYGEFIASLTPEDIKHVLYVHRNGWFSAASEVSGVIYCRERNFQFEFTYFRNPNALYSSAVLRTQVCPKAR